ncbi:WD repeat-containing protein 91 isoform 5-T5 [Megaptera novaeangliae]
MSWSASTCSSAASRTRCGSWTPRSRRTRRRGSGCGTEALREDVTCLKLPSELGASPRLEPRCPDSWSGAPFSTPASQQVDKIVDQLQQLMQVYDLAALRDYWNYLERRLFSRLEDMYRPTINKLKTSLFRFYLVYTIQTNRNDKAQEFFAKQATELQNQAEWKDWFVLPFLPSPDTNPIFAAYFSRQWADTFIVSLHNFLSVLFQCMPVPVILNFDAECQRTNQVQEENEVLRQKLFALQAEIHRLKKEEQQPEEEEALVQHRLPSYVSNMDRLGDSELAMVCSQRNASLSQSPRVGFLSSLLPQSKKSPSRLLPAQAPPQAQSSARKESSGGQSTKGREPACAPKDGKSLFSGLATGESSWSQHRQRRLQDHGKERKELFSMTLQCAEKKPEAGGPEAEPCPELHVEVLETLTRAPTAGAEGGGVRPEQPFIVLGQEEYGEHHSSIMHCRVDCSGRRVASLDVDGVIKVWSFNPIMQTKASSISKSPLLSLEWATKRDRLLLLGSGVGTVRLYDTEAKKNLCEISINDDMPRILSLACSPSGASFVCSAAVPSLAAQMDLSAPDIGSKGTNQVPGKLLLWDTKTMKQQPCLAWPSLLLQPPGAACPPRPAATRPSCMLSPLESVPTPLHPADICPPASPPVLPGSGAHCRQLHSLQSQREPAGHGGS